jgi:hypothetical protein
MKLTKKEVDKVSPPTTGQVFVRDTVIQGFALRVTANGVKSFVMEKRINGRPRRWTLGRYGELTVDQARALAQKRMVEIHDGRDPIAERHQRRQAPTFSDFESSSQPVAAAHAAEYYP